ncbi:MAG: LLM class F420-dependent oxidoreductase [Acidimicrobiia bacterium]|nr:LLM class F420-dependent oxidoreductase [Acidimicrobiia bacterium]
MRIGINGGGGIHRLEEAVEQARGAQRDGFASYWLSQIAGIDALTALAVIGREVPEIELGTAVVPTYPRHPLVLAIQALTVQAAIGGRLVLGIGPSHKLLVEGMLGYRFDRPYSHTREYHAALRSLLRGESTDFQGDQITARGKVDVVASPPPVLVAGLGPRMLDLAGSEAEGTVTWMCGIKTVAQHIAPRIRAAADGAGRPAPRIVVGLPVCVTDDPARARQLAAGKLALYGGLPSYRAMLDIEGVDGPEEIAVIGDEEQVRDSLRELAAAGATDLRATELCPTDEDAERTRALLREPR